MAYSKQFLGLSFSLVSVILSGCGGGSNSCPSESFKLGDIEVDSCFDTRSAQTLKKDWEFFNDLNIEGAGGDEKRDFIVADIKNLLEIDGPLTHTNIEDWLFSRVNHIVPPNYNFKKVKSSDKSFRYENPTAIPHEDIMIKVEDIQDNQKEFREMGVLMMNIGGLVYLSGKKEGVLYEMELNSGKNVEIKSPRAGVIIPGSQFKDFTKAEAKQGDNKAIKILRLATLWHEARHSDGNGASLGLLHDKCPNDHPAKGEYICENKRNGPYHIGAKMMRLMGNICSDCTTAENELLDELYLDSLGRITFTDEDEKQLRETLATSEAFLEKGTKNDVPLTAEEIDDLTKKINESKEKLKELYPDPKPEGVN